MALASASRLQPVAADQTKVRVVPQQATTKQTDISSNPIAKVVLDANAQDDEKVKTLAKTITADTLKDLQSFRAYLAGRRQAAQRRLLELTSTTAFPRLQSVIGSLQNGVVKIDKLMEPMTADLQAAFDLRTNNKMNEAIRQIDEDREKEAEWVKKHRDLETNISKVDQDASRLQSEIRRLQHDTGFFGGIKKSAQVAISEHMATLEKLKGSKTELESKQGDLEKEQSDYAARTYEYKEQKDRLRKMLDLGPAYVQKVEEIVNTALGFIDNSSSEVGGILGEFDGLEEQAKNILRSNSQMVRVTAILDRGIDSARTASVDKVQKLSIEPPDEDTLKRVTRTQEKNDVERFVTALFETATSVKKNVTELEQDAVGANNFSSVVSRQQTNLRELHGDGIASITTNLNMSLQAFNTAALTEAGNNAWQAIGDMNKVTNKIMNNEVVSSAMTIDDTNKRIVERFDSLSGVSEALKEANKIQAEGISNIASSLAELDRKTKEVQANLQTSIGLAANADQVVALDDEPIHEDHDLLMKI